MGVWRTVLSSMASPNSSDDNRELLKNEFVSDWSMAFVDSYCNLHISDTNNPYSWSTTFWKNVAWKCSIDYKCRKCSYAEFSTEKNWRENLVEISNKKSVETSVMSRLLATVTASHLCTISSPFIFAAHCSTDTQRTDAAGCTAGMQYAEQRAVWLITESDLIIRPNT